MESRLIFLRYNVFVIIYGGTHGVYGVDLMDFHMFIIWSCRKIHTSIQRRKHLVSEKSSDLLLIKSYICIVPRKSSTREHM